VEQLGAGGMSIVWRGFDDVLQRQVAVKLLHPDHVANTELRRRVHREAQAAARLSHPHIASIFDYGEASVTDAEPSPFVVMELIVGQPMSECLAGGVPMPWRDAVTVCAQVASALAQAHGQGVVHRDVKPSNVMLTSTGAKVVDFGISALVGESELGADGQLLGTPAYVAPERLVGGRASPAADVYALGLLLYQALSGGLPWDAATVTETLSAHRRIDPTPLPDLPEVPEPVIELCHRCLARTLEDRPSSAEVANALAEAAGISVHAPVVVGVIGLRHGAMPTAAIAVSATLPATLVSSHAFAPSLAVDRSLGRVLARLGVLGAMASRPRVRVAAMGLAAVALLAAAATAWVDPRATSGPISAMAVGPTPPTAESTPASCDVRYQVQRAWRGGFAAAVKVTNSGAAHVPDATLRFSFPGNQSIERRSVHAWAQVGRQVRAPVGGVGRPFAPGTSVTLRFTATYRSENPLPTAFFVGDTRRDALVSGPNPSTEVGSEGDDESGEGWSGRPGSGEGWSGKDGSGKDGSGKDGSGKDGSGKGGSDKGGSGKGKKGNNGEHDG